MRCWVSAVNRHGSGTPRMHRYNSRVGRGGRLTPDVIVSRQTMSKIAVAAPAKSRHLHPCGSWPLRCGRTGGVSDRSRSSGLRPLWRCSVAGGARAILLPRFYRPLQTSLHSCGPISRSIPLRPRPLNRSRGLRYRGPWHLPGPDSHRLATASLSPGYAIATPSLMASELLDARGSRLSPCLNGGRGASRHWGGWTRWPRLRPAP